GEADVGSLVDVGAAPGDDGDHVRYVRRLPAPAGAVDGLLAARDACRGLRDHRRHRRPDRPSLGALGELAAPASDGPSRRGITRARLIDAAHAHVLAWRVHAHLRLLHDGTRFARARASGAAVDPNLVFVVAAFAIVWGALLAYLISLRARGV